MTASYFFGVDWNADGDFSDPTEDLTERALLRSPITMGYGRDQIRAGSPLAAGKLDGELNNASRDYYPENTSSPLYGQVLPARETLMQATVGVTTYTMHRGTLDVFEPQPGVGEQSVRFSTLDGLALLKGVTISTDLYRGVRTGTAIGYVLDAVGWPAAARDLDVGATVIRWWWEDRADAFTAVGKLVDSEGLPALVYVDPATGFFTFRDRHHRITRAASITPQVTLSDVNGPEPRLTAPLGYDHGWRDIYNQVTFSVAERDPASEITAVWSSNSQITIADGQTLAVRVSTSDPFLGAVVPEAGTDYQLLSGAVTITLSRTQGASAVIYIRATGGPAVLDALQLRAYSVGVRRTIEVTAEDTTSQATYGKRSWPGEVPWAGVHDADAIADIILAHRAERLPVIRVKLVSANDTRLVQMLSRKLSDRVRVVDDETGIDADFFLERIEHTVARGLVHTAVFGLEKAAATPATAFRFDVAGAGFNDGTFALGGLSDPNTVFRFDVAGKGFDDGLLAY